MFGPSGLRHTRPRNKWSNDSTSLPRARISWRLSLHQLLWKILRATTAKTTTIMRFRFSIYWNARVADICTSCRLIRTFLNNRGYKLGKEKWQTTPAAKHHEQRQRNQKWMVSMLQYYCYMGFLNHGIIFFWKYHRYLWTMTNIPDRPVSCSVRNTPRSATNRILVYCLCSASRVTAREGDSAIGVVTIRYYRIS